MHAVNGCLTSPPQLLPQPLPLLPSRRHAHNVAARPDEHSPPHKQTHLHIHTPGSHAVDWCARGSGAGRRRPARTASPLGRAAATLARPHPCTSPEAASMQPARCVRPAV
eukprot:19118-Chlamydomonas_euryale.AAC.5